MTIREKISLSFLCACLLFSFYSIPFLCTILNSVFFLSLPWFVLAFARLPKLSACEGVCVQYINELIYILSFVLWNFSNNVLNRIDLLLLFLFLLSEYWIFFIHFIWDFQSGIFTSTTGLHRETKKNEWCWKNIKSGTELFPVARIKQKLIINFTKFVHRNSKIMHSLHSI